MIGRKNIILVISILAILLFLTVSRAVLTQRQYIKIAELKSGLEAIKAYEKVLLFYVPFSYYNDRAVNGILEICKVLDAYEEKLYCYETVRSSLLQIKSFYQPYSEVLKDVNSKIAYLRASLYLRRDNLYSANDFNKLYMLQLNLLNYDNSPSTSWSFISVVSLMFWIGFVIYGIYVNAILGILGFLTFFILWMVGLYMA